MKNVIIYATVFFLIVTPVFGVPANSIPFTYRQPDGAILSLKLVGDEYYHHYITRDGIPVVSLNDSAFYYTTIEEGNLVPSIYLAHNLEERNYQEEEFIDKNIGPVKDLILAKKSIIKRTSQAPDINCSRQFHLGESSSFIGTKKGLVILVEFSNRDMISGSASKLERMFNEEGYSGDGHIGSVHDYFLDQSYGKFNLLFDVVGPVKVSHQFGYYGSNRSQEVGGDRYPGEMVTEACLLIDNQVDFSKYDWDGDGEVEQVFIVYAGYGEATGGASSTIWPHKFDLTGCKRFGDGDGPLLLDGVKIDTYACSNELTGSMGSIMNGIGTACHEFSHCLGLPDLYDTDYSGAFGMSYFDIMDSGAHSGPNGRGEVPYGYSAYERWFAGWLELDEINTNTKISEMRNLQESEKAYIIYNEHNENEYFILENHQNTGWYRYTGTSTLCHGLMITHVNYDSWAWSSNQVNSDLDHQRMSIIPADGSYGTKNSNRYYPTGNDLAGDLFPGTNNVTEFTNTSHTDVGGVFFNSNSEGSHNLNMAVMNIVEEMGNISFDAVFGHNIAVPTILMPIEINESGFTARWESVDGADCYNIELTEYISEKPYIVNVTTIDDIEESFYTFTNLTHKGYSYRVRAKMNGFYSFWSERVVLNLETEGIECVTHVPNLDSKYYSLSGRIVTNPKRKGLYIVKNRRGYCKLYINKQP